MDTRESVESAIENLSTENIKRFHKAVDAACKAANSVRDFRPQAEDRIQVLLSAAGKICADEHDKIDLSKLRHSFDKYLFTMRLLVDQSRNKESGH